MYSNCIQDNVIIQRRVEYLETQLKKTQTEFKDHATNVCMLYGRIKKSSTGLFTRNEI